MRKAAPCILIVSLCVGFGVAVHAASDPALATAEALRDRVTQDITDASSFTCGGMAYNDARLGAYYHREQQPMECKLTSICNSFDPEQGFCNNIKCKIYYEDGLPERSLASQCDAAGTCTEPVPHEACPFSPDSSKYRVWSCEKGALKEAHCYSYFPSYRYEQSYSPYSFNCLGIYRSSPVRATEPLGELALEPALDLLPDPRLVAPGWSTVPGSAVATLRNQENPLPDDGTLPGLTLDMISLTPKPANTSYIYASPFWQQDYPDLENIMNELLRPPEIRLILPYGSASFPQTELSWLRKFFPFLQGDKPARQSAIVSTLREEPDLLESAAEFLRSTPLIEVRYVPVAVQVPTASPMELQALASSWEVWLAHLEKRVGEHADATMPSGLADRIRGNVAAIRSTIALQDSIREYRLTFPRYLDALLEYVEKTNKFHTDWLTLNADRLQAWHTAYANYLPALRTRIKVVRDLAATVTKECLVPTCRLDVLPVKPADATGKPVRPWSLFPDIGADPSADPLTSPEFPMDPKDAAWLPEGPPLWKDAENDLARGELARQHMPAVIGVPLPDLTFDFSQMLRTHTIEVPVVRLENLPISIPNPPADFDPTTYSGDRLQSRMNLLLEDLPQVERLAPPSFRLEFPIINVPDPASSLLLVPPAPEALPTWQKMLDWREKRLQMIQSVCDPNPSTTTFLFSEHMLLAGQHVQEINKLSNIELSVYDPARLRAYGFHPGGAAQIFSYLSHSIPLSEYWYQYPWWNWYNWRRCENCMQERPQRTFRQYLQVEVRWEDLQENILRLVDTWNAQVQYHTIVSREEMAERDPQPWEQDQPLLK